MRRLVASTLTASALLLSRQADASPLIELAGGTSSGAGLSGRFTGDGASSTYFSPARLSLATQGVELGVLVVSDHIGITLDPRLRGNVPDAVGRRDAVDATGSPIPNGTVPTRWLSRGCPTDECDGGFAARPRQAAGSGGNTRAYQIIGLVNRVVDDRLVLGFYALVPLGPFTTARSFYNDEREQVFSNSLHPEMYADRLTATSVAFGVGSRIADGLRVGLSFTLSLRNAADASTYVRDANDYDKLHLDTDVEVRASVSPHLSVQWQPARALSFTAAVHSQQQFEIETAFSALLPNGSSSRTVRRSVHDFVPWQFALGTEVDLLRTDAHRLSVVAGAWAGLWSAYLDRHGERPSSYGGAYGFSNTLSYVGGVRYERGRVRALADVGYAPSPVPEQTGRSNYVDNDRASAALGLDVAFELFGLRLRAGATGQAHALLERHHTKDDRRIVDEVPDDATLPSGSAVPFREGLQTNNPGWPGFSSKGLVTAAAATLTLQY